MVIVPWSGVRTRGAAEPVRFEGWEGRVGDGSGSCLDRSGWCGDWRGGVGTEGRGRGGAKLRDIVGIDRVVESGPLPPAGHGARTCVSRGHTARIRTRISTETRTGSKRPQVWPEQKKIVSQSFFD